MRTRAQVCTWIAAVAVLQPCVAAGQDLTQREIVELIVRDGPQARAIRAEVEVTRHEQEARLAFPNPSVSYTHEGAGVTDFFQGEQILPIFGSRAALERAGVSAVAAAEAERDVRLWALRSEAAAAAARQVTGQARLDSARGLVTEVERLIDILRTREREGEGSRFDRLRAEQELREARQVQTSAVVSVAEARASLAAMLPPDTPLVGIAMSQQASRPAPPLDALLTRATSARGELRALQAMGERATFEADAARRARRPAPTVSAGVKRADVAFGKETGAVFGVSVALPLFDGGSRESARWEAEGTRVAAQRASIESRIRTEITVASETVSLRQMALAEEPPDAGDELAQIAQVAYREGEVGILELLDALRTASRARIRIIEMHLDTRLAEIALERAVGETLWP